MENKVNIIIVDMKYLNRTDFVFFRLGFFDILSTDFGLLVCWRPGFENSILRKANEND